MSVITPTQIANRALQRVGSARLPTGTLLTDTSKAADEVRACYDILRRAELRRNVWRFSIRVVALRALASTSQQVTFGAYSAVSAYKQNDVVVASDGQTYVSLIAANTGNDPTSTSGKWTLYFGPVIATPFDATLSYFAGELVTETGVLYLSLVSGNTHDPATDISGSWLTFTTAPTLSAVNFIYPIGSGPSSETSTANVYILPYGFLREAPQSPKAGSNAFLGGPAGLRYTDWQFENNCFTSFDPGPVLFRFAADVSDTSLFDPLFVEGFACRIALEVCEPLTQSTDKLNSIASEYKKFMGEARLVNGIETGATEPPIDEYIAVRM